MSLKRALEAKLKVTSSQADEALLYMPPRRVVAI